MKDHPAISLRTLGSTYMARCKGFTKEVLMEFFDRYEDKNSQRARSTM